jgi:ribosomal protein L29
LPEPEPEPPKLDTDLGARIDAAVEAVRAEFRAELEGSRAFILEVVAEGLGECMRTQREDASAELADRVRELKIELAELQTTLCELRQALAIERTQVHNLPNPIAPRRVN